MHACAWLSNPCDAKEGCKEDSKYSENRQRSVEFDKRSSEDFTGPQCGATGDICPHKRGATVRVDKRCVGAGNTDNEEPEGAIGLRGGSDCCATPVAGQEDVHFLKLLPRQRRDGAG